MEPIAALQMLYNSVRTKNLTAQEHEQLKQAAMIVDACITKQMNQEKEPDQGE